jgi:hypothetical protein
MTKNIPRGIRNHNPGNIRRSRDPWQGLAPEQRDKAFFQFVTPAYGIRALARVLITYQDKYGLRSVGEIINRWAPPIENNTPAYVAAVCRRCGWEGGSAELDLQTYRDLRPLVEAIIWHENGQQPYSRAQIDEGLRLAGVTPPKASAAKDPKVIAGGVVAVATVAQQTIAQVEGIWTSLQNMGVSPHLVLALLGLAALGVGAWFLIDRWRRSRQGLS